MATASDKLADEPNIIDTPHAETDGGAAGYLVFKIGFSLR